MISSKNIPVRKICNPINCYYANELMNFENIENNPLASDDCPLCSYNFNNIVKTRKFIRDELKK